jgi:hypothetical protein
MRALTLRFASGPEEPFPDLFLIELKVCGDFVQDAREGPNTKNLVIRNRQVMLAAG